MSDKIIATKGLIDGLASMGLKLTDEQIQFVNNEIEHMYFGSYFGQPVNGSFGQVFPDKFFVTNENKVIESLINSLETNPEIVSKAIPLISDEKSIAAIKNGVTKRLQRLLEVQK